MATSTKRRALPKADKLRVKWEVKGVIASVYNITKSTSYAVYRTNDKWICTCPAAEHNMDCKHRRAVEAKHDSAGTN